MFVFLAGRLVPGENGVRVWAVHQANERTIR
jgi:hypothetical protein